MSATDSLRVRGARYVPAPADDTRLERLHRYLLARELAQDKTVLNMACGEGEGASLLAAVAHRVIGVDTEQEVIVRASRRFGRSNLTFRSGSCTAIPVMDASIDLLVSFETLEFDTRHPRMLAEMRRVLAPNGLLILSTLNRDGYAAGAPRNPFHVGALTRAELEQLLRTQFSQVSFAGQRMRAGSVVFPLDEQAHSRFLSFHEDEHHAKRVVDADAPQVLIALASDAPLPPLQIGLMDEGALGSASRPTLLSVPPPIDDTADALARRVADLARMHARERQRLVDLRGEMFRLHAAIDRHRQESLSAWESARAHQARSAEIEQQHLAALAAVKAAEAERASMAAAITAERETWRAREGQLLALLERISALADAREAATTVMERSRSWRLTRPLRDLRRLVSMMSTRATASTGKGRRR
jgi:ubiquinone/menaquinone biosynthesis C-methylase UbiE